MWDSETSICAGSPRHWHRLQPGNTTSAPEKRDSKGLFLVDLDVFCNHSCRLSWALPWPDKYFQTAIKLEEGYLLIPPVCPQTLLSCLWTYIITTSQAAHHLRASILQHLMFNKMSQSPVIQWDLLRTDCITQIASSKEQCHLSVSCVK